MTSPDVHAQPAAGAGRAARRRHGQPLGAARSVRTHPGIFYFLVLLPMRRRQKKVQEFQTSSEGRRPGHHDRRHLRQITELGRAASSCRSPTRSASSRARRHRRLPGPGAGRPAGEGQSVMNKNLRWKVLAIVAVSALAVWAFYPPAQKVGWASTSRAACTSSSGPDRRALRLETETTVEQLREAARERRRVPASRRRAPSPTEFRRGRCRRPGRAVPRSRATEVGPTFNRESGAAGTLRLPDEAEHRQPDPRGGGDAGASRRSSAASTSSASPSRSSRARAARRPDPRAAAGRDRRRARQGASSSPRRCSS